MPDPPRDALEPEVATPAHGLMGRVQRTEVWRSMFRHPQLDTPRGRRAPVVQQLLPPRVPGQDSGPGAAAALLVPARVHRRGAVRDPGRHRRVPDVLLHAVADRRVRRHATPQDRRRLRPAHPQRASLVGASHGAGHRAASRARLLCGRVQAATRVQLGDRRDTAAAHPRFVLHRIPLALGPAELLGRDRGHEPGSLRARVGRNAAGPAHRWRADRGEHVAALLRAPCRGAARVAHPRACGPHLAGPQGRVRGDAFERRGVRGGSNGAASRGRARRAVRRAGRGCSASSTASR